jgi:hypothetical protein
VAARPDGRAGIPNVRYASTIVDPELDLGDNRTI